MSTKFSSGFMLVSLLIIATALIAPCLSARGQTDPDAATIHQLQKAGSDLTKPHEPEFFLYLPTEVTARQVADSLTHLGFTTQAKHAEQGTDWLCRATKRMILTHDALAKLRLDFIALLTPLGGDYDGWGAEVVK
jgi:hypothetical protein